MRAPVLWTSILLLFLGSSASVAAPYGYQPGGNYRYPAGPQYNPSSRRGYFPAYRPVPVYPYGYSYRPAPVQQLPQAPAPASIPAPAKLPVKASPLPSVIEPAKRNPFEQKATESRETIADRKLAFLQKIAPLVHQINDNVRKERAELVKLIEQTDKDHELSKEQVVWLQYRLKKYRVKAEGLDNQELLEALLPKVDVIPVELALAQAANESAWGKSRFAREAQNLFGIWTYDESKGIVPKKRAKGAKHLVRKYGSMEESVRHYVTLLNSHPAYQKLRDIRLSLRQKEQLPDGFAMAQGLIKYSAKGEEYVALIRSMISKNNLTAFRSA